MKYLADMFSEGDGSPSSMRFLVALVVLLTLLPGTIAAVKTGENLTLTTEQVAMITLALGAKAVQKSQEIKTPPAP